MANKSIVLYFQYYNAYNTRSRHLELSSNFQEVKKILHSAHFIWGGHQVQLGGGGTAPWCPPPRGDAPVSAVFLLIILLENVTVKTLQDMTSLKEDHDRL